MKNVSYKEILKTEQLRLRHAGKILFDNLQGSIEIYSRSTSLIVYYRCYQRAGENLKCVCLEYCLGCHNRSDSYKLYDLNASKLFHGDAKLSR